VLFQEDNTQKRTSRIAMTQAGFEVVEDPYYTLFESVRIMHGKGILIKMATSVEGVFLNLASKLVLKSRL
jgi:hypothetical protein